MEPQTLPEFIAYFRRLAARHVELKGSFVHGSAGRIIAGSRSGMEYPCLWLETPTLAMAEKDDNFPLGTRRAAFVILARVPPDDYEAQDAGWASTERIALDVLAMLRHDRKARLFSFGLGGILEPVATLTVDNEIGWRFEFEQGRPVALVVDESRWLPAVQEEGGRLV